MICAMYDRDVMYLFDTCYFQFESIIIQIYTFALLCAFLLPIIIHTLPL